MTPLWTGIAVALVTLFEDDGTVAVDATAAHAARLVDAGLPALLVNGSTGEAVTLTDDERAAVVAAVRAACPGVPVVAGTSGDWWRLAAERAAAAVAAGADAVLVAPPRLGADLKDYYGRVAASVGETPVLAYHFPGVAGGEVPVDALGSLPVQGQKDSTGSPERLLHALETWSGWTYVGSAMLVSYAAALGAAGAILAVANVVPEDCLAAWDGDLAAQRRLLAPHLEGQQRFPYGLKAAMARRYGTPVNARIG